MIASTRWRCRVLGLLRRTRGLTRAVSQVRGTVAVLYCPVEHLLDFLGHLLVGVGAQNLVVCVACFRRGVGAPDLARLAIRNVVVSEMAICCCSAWPDELFLHNRLETVDGRVVPDHLLASSSLPLIACSYASHGYSLSHGPDQFPGAFATRTFAASISSGVRRLRTLEKP